MTNDLVNGGSEYVIDCPRCGHCCQQREWARLTHEDIKDAMRSIGMMGHVNDGRVKFAQAVEAKLKEKNT